MVLHGLRLLLLKNILLLKRRPVVTALEIILPLFSVMVLLIIRQVVNSEQISDPVVYPSFQFHGIPTNLSVFHFKSYYLAYTPETGLTKQLMENVKNDLGNIDDIFGFPTEADLEKFFKNVNNFKGQQTLAGIVFRNDLTESSKNLNYTLRFYYQARYNATMASGFSLTDNWRTTQMYDAIATPGPREKSSSDGGSPGYNREGFLPLQASLDRAWMSYCYQNSSSEPDVDIAFRRMPYPPYLDDGFLIIIQLQMPFIIIMSFQFAILDIVKSIVYEKEKRIKESLKMMGVGSMAHWVAWFITYFSLLSISALLIALFLWVKIPPKGSLLAKSNPIIMFIFLVLFISCTTCYAFFVSVFFKSANAGAAAGGVAYFLSYLPYLYISGSYSSFGLGVLLPSCLLPNIAVGLGMRLVGAFEGADVGLQWSNIAYGPTVEDPFNMLYIWMMLVIDSVWLMSACYYVEQVFPGEYGIPLKWYFPFTKSFWCSSSGSASFSSVGPHQEEKAAIPEGKEDFFQEEPKNIKAGVQIRNLSKVFGRGKTRRVAVDSLNLNMYNGEITVLLGHNGAGKTTTMSMITGFIPPSSGTAFINDLDIRTDMELIRKNLGLCPQHDILFDNLTVTEHLMFAARLKGVTDPLKLKKEIDEMIVNINLFRKKEVLAKNLSGGMRRRLSLGMALIGGTKIVILDEPTSGLDPDARREIWTLLQKERANRTMLLTTHFMDEAEILGDRVAIMSAGQIQCCGTPLFLKNCYGAEYHLSLVKAEKCDVSKVLEVVAESVPEYRIESNVSNELSILLPAASSPAFPKLFHDIESNKVELGIRSYGASVTTMEEVFLKVGSYEEEEQARRAEVEAEQEHLNEAHIIRERQLPAPVVDSSASINIPFSASESLRFNTGFQFLFQQFLSLLHKRWIVFRQHKILSLAQMLVPVVFTALGIFITRAAPVAVKGPPLNLDLSSFQNLVMPYAVGANSSITSEDSKIIQSFVNLFRSRRNTEVVNVTKADASYLDYLIDFSKKDLFRYNRQYIIGSTFEKNINTNTLEWTAYFNNQPFHTVGILQNYISNALLAVQGDGQCSVSTVNHPLPMTINDELNDLTIQSALGFSFSITLVFGMAFLISSFAPPLIRERVSKSKHLQYISGCKTVSYWLSAYLWDLLNFFVPSVLVIITLAIFNETPYVGDFRFMVTFFLLFSFSACAIPFIYLLSHLFTIPSSGLTWLVRFNILTGLISILTVNILRIPQLNLVEYAKALEWVFYIFLPNFCLGQGFTNIYTNNLYLSLCTKPEIAQLCELNLFSSPCCPKTCGNNCLQYEENYLSWNPYGIGRSLFFMYLQGMICWVVLFLMETSGFTYLKSLISAKAKNVFYVPLVEEEAVSMQDSEDSDLKEERELIESSDLNELRKVKSVIMRNVSKTYGTFRAVDRVSCTVTPGNCFGLLGVNGAGKTTTFNMLTGDLDLTAGEVYINGYDLASSCRDAQRTLGYCPQYDALIEEMTGREQLTFYCHLRGMDKTQISSEVERLLKTLNLQNYADVQCGTYSGGNKRKLNTALALVGSPPLVCLDEPTTGMDPGARRQLWNTLTKYRNEGNTLILTSHSMEECEALCTQVVIMVNGRFQCIGSIQHLKTKFAEGYTALIQLAYPTEEVGEKRVTNLMDFMSREFGEHYSVKDRHQGHVHFQILKSPSLTWARIFGLFESNRQSLNIVHYSVTQTSLEQVFLGFARNQVPPLEAPERKCFLRCCQHKTKD